PFQQFSRVAARIVIVAWSRSGCRCGRRRLWLWLDALIKRPGAVEQDFALSLSNLGNACQVAVDQLVEVAGRMTCRRAADRDNISALASGLDQCFAVSALSQFGIAGDRRAAIGDV